MAISLDHVVVGANESIFVKIQGSAERSILISVSKSGRCFVAAPYNANKKVFELSIDGMGQVAISEAAQALGLGL